MGRIKKLALTLCALAAVGTTLALLLTASAPQVPSDTWAPTGDMATSRAGSAAALLPDGRVIVTGGTNGAAVTSTAERYSPAAGSFLATPAMQDARANHSATLLADGHVLVAGGVGADGHVLASAEIYDGVANAWTPVAPLYRARAGHTATLLPDGRVLIAGGDDAGAAIDSLEVFDPIAGVFSQLASTLSSPRTGHAAALLGDGRVLLVGGFNGTNALASTDVFDGAGGDAVSAGPSLGTARAGASATTLLDGTVFVAGGAGDTAELATTEIFNPGTNAFAPGATLAAARQRHQAFLLPHNNNVLIVGGTQGGNAVATAELYQPWNYTMLPAGAPSVARAWAAGSALSYPASLTIRSGPNDGEVLLAGGSAKADASSPMKSAELYGFATIKTDQADYAPGTTVTITGSGWQPGETVALTLLEQPLLDTHPLLSVTADGNGNITSTEFVPDAHDLNVKFYLTAYGSTSQAQTTFTDAKPNKISAVGSQTPSPVSAGNSATYSVTVTFNGNATSCNAVLSASGLPAGASASFAPSPSGNPANTITSTGANVTTTLTVSTTAGTTPPATSTFRITATGNGGGCTSSDTASTSAGGGGGVAADPTLVVSKADQTITLGALGAKTYGDTDFTVSANSSSGLAVSFASQTATVCTVTGTTVHIVSQGTCTIRASQAGNANYNAAPDVDQSFTVNKKLVTVSFTAADKTYDGSNIATVSACVIATGKVGSDDVTCTVASGTFASANASVSAQAVSATATLGGAAVSNYTVTNPVTTTAKINKAAATVVVTPYSVTYDGQSHAAAIASITGVNGETGATVGTVNITNTTHTNAGTYATDSWSFTGAANYDDIAATTITDTINKAPATVVVTPYTVIYDGQSHAAAITSITGVNGETGATVGTVNVTNTTHTNAGTYATDSWSFTGAANYQNIAPTTITDTINQATATVVVTPYSVTYDGQSHTAAITSITGVNGETGATVGTVNVSNTTHTNAGTYASDSWSFTGAANYQNIAGTTITDTINKATATVVVTPYTVSYNGQAHTATVTSITGVTGETGATVGSVDVSNTTHSSAGTYASDSWSFTGTANYENIGVTTITDTINQATATVVVAPYTVTYNGLPHTATVTSITGVNGETGATVGTVDVSNTTHSSAGTYASDSWSFTGTANYENIGVTTITDTINQATATVVVAPYTVTYNGLPHTATVTSITGVNGETGATVGTVDVSNTTHTGASIYTSDSWSFTGTANYQNIAATTITDTINQATATVVVAPYTVTYNGLPHTATVTSITGVNSETGATVGTVDLSNTSHTNAGTYASDSWSFTGTANYQNIAATTITDTVNQATATVVVTPYSVTYDGLSHTAAITSITGVNSETGANVGTVDVSNTTHTGASIYSSDSWSFTGTANYQNIAATTITDVINQAGSSTNVTVVDATYDGSPHGGSASVTGVGGLNQSLTVHYTGRNGTVYADSVTAPTGAGDYTASATFAGDTNHAGSADSKAFTINRAPSSTLVSCPASVDYSGSPLTPCAAAVSGVGGLSLVGTPIDYTNNVAKGQATALYTYAGDVNHAGSSGLAHFQIVDAHPIAQAKQVEVIVRPFHDDGDDDDRHDHDEFNRRGNDGHGWDHNLGDDDDTDGEWEHDADNAKAVRITLSATDADSLRLTFSILTAPTHGRLSRVRKVSCTPDGHGGTLCTARVIYLPQPHNAAGDTFTYQASDGVLNSAPATVTINIVPPFTTFTQGQWGSTSNGQNPGWFLATNFASVYSGGIVAIGTGTRTLSFDSAAAIKSFLPAGGKAGILLTGTLDPTSSKGGVFAGQVLALQLNVDFSAALKTRSGLGALVLTKGALKGQTVVQVLTLANNVLGGGALPAGMSISDLSDIVSKINDNYDRGKEDDGYLK